MKSLFLVEGESRGDRGFPSLAGRQVLIEISGVPEVPLKPEYLYYTIDRFHEDVKYVHSKRRQGEVRLDPHHIKTSIRFKSDDRVGFKSEYTYRHTAWDRIP